MPTLARFYGITMRMYYQQSEHNPPHVHAQYGDMSAEIEIKTGEILDGNLPKKILALVSEWVHLHQEELIAVWDTQEFKKIAPLEK